MLLSIGNWREQRTMEPSTGSALGTGAEFLFMHFDVPKLGEAHRQQVREPLIR